MRIMQIIFVMVFFHLLKMKTIMYSAKNTLMRDMSIVENMRRFVPQIMSLCRVFAVRETLILWWSCSVAITVDARIDENTLSAK